MKASNRLIMESIAFLFLLVATARVTQSQVVAKEPEQEQIPVATQWLLNAAKSAQRNAIKSVFLLVCPKSSRKGTAFLLKTGTVVSDAHVVEGCEAGDLWAQSATGKKIKFVKMITDQKRDLAMLRPSERLEGGLELGSNFDPALKAQALTWGFPLSYRGPAPLLSVGYVAGLHLG